MRTPLKLAIVSAGHTHQKLADQANRLLPEGERISELVISKFVTSRKDPTPAQASALAKVLGKSVKELFE